MSYLIFVPGEELSKKQAAQESQIRKLRAQVYAKLGLSVSYHPEAYNWLLISANVVIM